MDILHKTDYVRVKWHKKDIIRHKESGHPFLVLHIYKNIGTMVVDLEDHKALRTTFMLLPSDYDQYVLDQEMKCIQQDEYHISFSYDPKFFTPAIL